MKLKGDMVIELTDTNTGAVETVQETNMITEAVNNILGLNPMGIYLKASGEYDNSVLWNGTLLPICPRNANLGRCCKQRILWKICDLYREQKHDRV